MPNQTRRAKAVLEKIIYATVATVSAEGHPWNSPVRYVYDNDLHIYWFSDKQSQHSQNVRDTQRAFIVIYDSTVKEGDGLGLYIEASVEEVTSPEEILQARKLKNGENYNKPASDFLGDTVRRVYRATPERIWLNDDEERDGIFIRDIRTELQLTELMEVLRNDETIQYAY